MNPPSPLLAVRNLQVSYHNVHALKGIAVEIYPQEIVALVGSNGAGKSTLMHTIMGLVKAQAGSITFQDQEISGLSPYRIVRRGITLIPEGRKVFPDHSVEDNLHLGAYSRRRWWNKEDLTQKKDELYALFPILRERRHQLAGTLSGGEQQMLAFARGLMSEPDLLLLDEPSLGLAPLLVRELFHILQVLKSRQETIFLVEQMAWMALEACDRAYVIQTGTVVRAGRGSDLLRDSKLLEAYLGKQK
jgi:branched-chain amino acid transport system ATP-binding protein